MPGLRHTTAFRTGRDDQGHELTADDRERLLKPYLPRGTQDRSNPQYSTAKRQIRFQHKQRVRPAVKNIFYNLVFTLVQAVFTIYITIRQVYHALLDRVIAILSYHHRTPELIQRDVKGLKRLPKHLSIILELPPEGGKKDRLETLVSDACEIAAWSASAGIPLLSIYERTGILKSSLPHVHGRISDALDAYFGVNALSRPTFSLRAPNLPSYSPPHSPTPAEEETSNISPDSPSTSAPHLTILLIDSTDGRQTLVDLTKTLSEMAQSSKLRPADISSELIDAEISESVMNEPDLLITFKGDRVVLEGYPPWQVRLTEIFQVRDNAHGVGYHVFLRGLYKYAEAEFRVGR